MNLHVEMNVHDVKNLHKLKTFFFTLLSHVFFFNLLSHVKKSQCHYIVYLTIYLFSSFVSLIDRRRRQFIKFFKLINKPCP